MLVNDHDFVKKPKRQGHKIGILIIFIGSAYVFISESIKTESIEPLFIFILTVLFVFFGYWRIYQYYKLEKLWHDHNKKDFIDYFDNMTFYEAAKHCVTPLPLLNKFDTEEENNIRRLINFSTLMIYLLVISYLLLLT